jgi:formate--tetrahydrofolate ligase
MGKVRQPPAEGQIHLTACRFGWLVSGFCVRTGASPINKSSRDPSDLEAVPQLCHGLIQMPASQHQSPKSDIEISQAAKKRPIMEIARERLGIAPENLEPFGHYKAKVSMDFIKSIQSRPNGKLILVTAINPTPAGEGKTTTTVGLTDALNYIGKKAMLCIREPSLGPSFGMKGGAAGGGYAQVVPMEDINLHFTGDFHAITSANNLLAALLDNHIYWGNALGIDSRRVAWRRVLDMNDRALRSIVNSLGGVANGFPREDGFDITVASEVMAIFCLARNLDDLKNRLGNIVVAYTRDRKPVRAAGLKAHGAMTVLLKEALAPNLVQTMEGTPAFIHGGPFANIAHGCNSVLATTTALKLADYVVTEAGFGADLGAEKFMDIKCRKAGIAPDCVVLVATIRALKMHGGVKKEDLKAENLKALEAGMANLQRHVENMQKFGIQPVVSINRFSADTEAEIKLVQEKCKALGVEALMADHWAMGGEGAADVARAVVKIADSGKSKLKYLYPDDMPLTEKIRTICREIYRAKDISMDKSVRDQLASFEAMGYGKFPICMAKTQYSFTTNPDAKGAPSDHIIPVREVRLSAGAEFVVVICGELLTMPGLPKVPAADSIDVGPDGRIVGLF